MANTLSPQYLYGLRNLPVIYASMDAVAIGQVNDVHILQQFYFHCFTMCSIITGKYMI